ncbi:MAG: hypothetical protein LBH13_02345 [Cellulomonadaceae bacterium]|jgi:hypothetical protein|nr:hypothetical protein [Cellulomonadaceae bacterium]
MSDTSDINYGLQRFDDEPADAIPARARSTAYIIGLVLGAIGTLIIGITGTLCDPDTATRVASVTGAITTCGMTIIGGLGTIYRPTS